jgi:hypothetical protein
LCPAFSPFTNPTVVDLQRKKNSAEEREKDEWMAMVKA